MKIRSGRFARFLLPIVVLGIASRAWSQVPDFSVLRINEVLTNNELAEPADHTGHHHDMVEIYNGGEQLLVLGKSPSSMSLALSDTVDQPPESQLWKFKGGGVSNIPSKGFITVFVANEPDGALSCELFTDKFKLANDGSEPITLWGPADAEGKRAIIDQVWLPPLDNDVSFGRFPDGAGPAKPTIDETLQYFKYYPAGTTTFGTCGNVCNAGTAICRGAPNGPGGNLPPKVNRLSHTTNHPAADQEVTFTVSVEDDKDPLPSDLKTVAIRYKVNGAAQPDIAMTYDGSGIHTAEADGRPLERWTVWNGTVPGQAEGAKVEFVFYAEDVESLSRTDPKDLCAESVGPCDDIGLPGPNCVKEPAPGLQYLPCSVPFRYTAGYVPPADLAGVLLNEVMAVQTKTIEDPTQPGHYDDYIEIFNSSQAEVSLAGLWLADKPFEPQGWQFPDGSKIAAGEHLIVWCDSDGGKCPRPPKQSGDGQECPDPTNPATQSYHTNFGLEADGDQIYLYDRLPGLGVIDGYEFGAQKSDKALARDPDGSREGSFVEQDGTPGQPNGSKPPEPQFRRGDTNGDCQADITDAIVLLDFLFRGGAAPSCPDAADSDDNGSLQITDPIYLLQYLFQGGPAPPDPGATTPGPDPTLDTLGDCEGTSC